MWLQTCTCRLGIVALLLCATVAACSKGNGATDRGAPGPNTKPRHPLADVGDTYRSGKPEKAREMAMRLAEKSMKAIEKETRLDSKLASAQSVVVTAGAVVEWETDRSRSQGKPMDEPSRKAAAGLIEMMDRAIKLASKETANSTLGERELGIQRETDKLRVRVLKNWIASNPREQREPIYQAHREFLESQGVKPAGLVDATDTPPEPTADDRLLESAKADTEQIRKAVGAFYGALAAADAKGLRAVVSTTTTDEAMSNVLNRSEAEKKRSEIRRVVSVGLDKARIEPERVSNGHVVVRVSGIVVTLEKAGGTSVTDHTEIFLFVKEKERWVPCFK